MQMPNNRWQAFLIHLGASTAIFLILLYLIVFVWYPQPYFAADGGWQGIQIITGVDLVLGPTLTLLVYRPGKHGLKFDLTVIAMVQAVALVVGTWLVHEQRTMMVTFADGTFWTLSPNQVRETGGRAPEILATSSQRPAYAFVRLPRDRNERSALRRKLFFSGVVLTQRGDLYESLSARHLPELQEYSVALERYAEIWDGNRRELDRFLRRHGGTPGDYIFLPLVARYNSVFLALRREDGAILDSLDIRRIPPVDAASPSPPGHRPAQ